MNDEQNRSPQDVLLKEVEIDHSYLMSVERAMFDHFRFLVLFIVSEVAAAAVAVRFFHGARQFGMARGILLSLSLVATAVFYFGRYMYLELRIRKIKMLEQIAIIRKRWQARFPEVRSDFVLISGISKCPPYLRIGCSEWHTMNFMSCCYAVSLAGTAYCSFSLAAWWQGFGGEGFYAPLWYQWVVIGYALVAFFLGSWEWSWNAALYYDAKRQFDHKVPNEYKLLEHYGRILGFFPWLLSWVQGKLAPNALKRHLCSIGRSTARGIHCSSSCSCVFCREVEQGHFVVATTSFVVRRDGYPVTQGHMLVIPKRHVTSVDDLTGAEMVELPQCIQLAKQESQKSRPANGFNIGVNEGKAAGQTVDHLHVHVIPRREGDVADPTGGIRNVIPGRGPYHPSGNEVPGEAGGGLG